MNRYPVWKYIIIAIPSCWAHCLRLRTISANRRRCRSPAADPPSRSPVSPDARVDSLLKQERLATKPSLDGAGSHLSVRVRLRHRHPIQGQLALDARSTPIQKIRLHRHHQPTAKTPPAWMRSIDAQPMYLGLDLRGGVHFLMQVDMQGGADEERPEPAWPPTSARCCATRPSRHAGVTREGNDRRRATSATTQPAQQRAERCCADQVPDLRLGAVRRRHRAAAP